MQEYNLNMAKEFTSKEAKLLTNKHHILLTQLNRASSLDTILEDNLKKAADSFVVNEVIKVLRKIPVDELSRDKKGIRIKALIENNLINMADLYVSSVYDIASVRGISNETAYTIKSIVNKYFNKTKSEIKIRLSADDKNKYTTELVKAISIYKNSLPYIENSKELLSKNYKYIKDKISDLKPASNSIRWFFTTKNTKTKAVEAYVKLNELLNNSYSTDASTISAFLDNISKTSDVEAWSDFVENNVTFYNFLEKTNYELLGTDDDLYGLPEDLAREIQDECFFPDGLKCTLRRYQEWGVKYILHQERVLLGDEMGLGKTIQAIATMVSLKNVGATHFIVVCPASVVTNWCREITKHSLLCAVKVHGKNSRSVLKSWIQAGGVAVTTYETTGLFKLENDFKYELLIVDEAHYIKNPEAKRTINVQQLSKNANRLLFMTGTALENRVEEMIWLISLLQPKIALQIQDLTFMASAPQFRNKVSPVYYRRKREDVLTELPELIESKEWCLMSDEKERIYEEAISNRHFADARRVSWSVENLKYSSKANRLKEIVEEAQLENRKVIVFSFFLDTIYKIYTLLGDKCLAPINGSVSPQRRQEIIDEFDKSPAGSVLVSQILSGGTGLNIQSASVVVICEPQLKPSIENQAISRAYRMGQSRNVLVYRLLCENSIDEKITDILEKKQDVFDNFADKSVSAQKSLEIDDKLFKNIIAEEIERINKKRENAATQTLNE